MNINDAYKAYLMVGWLYLITTTFTLAKTLSDAHDADLAEIKEAAREEARAELRIRPPIVTGVSGVTGVPVEQRQQVAK